MEKDVIVACDFNSKADVIKFLSMFEGESLYIKIGMELFYAEGPDIISEIKQRGHKVFLDLKLHDIPNTVRKTMKVLANLNIDMCNVHASGTIEMMEAAIQGLTKKDGSRPILVAVTQLTSTSQDKMRKDLLIEKTVDEVVLHYAQNAKIAGLDGVVCSPQEAKKIHEFCGKDFLTITPGVRFMDEEKDDQIRVMTPEQAKAEGSDYIVVGRPITNADNPLKAYRKYVKEFVG
ncbi:MAG TPA: orotidine-5'-phosphate decarboxylase [Lachnospiraceae bacterium]|nr:orotidine-5'-phosphate decarboxylase [Lachnospiraceae bacterium]